MYSSLLIHGTDPTVLAAGAENNYRLNMLVYHFPTASGTLAE
jgi:hypothetical protein